MNRAEHSATIRTHLTEGAVSTMASALYELRKQAGFKSAKDFAAAEGIPAATYARYESSPDKIPLKSAWQLADRFGVAIDVIVGRARPEKPAAGGAVQQAFDALTEQSQASLSDYLAFLSQRDERQAAQRAADELRRYDAVCYRLEQVFLAELDEQGSSLFAFGTPARMRGAFESFLKKRAAEKGDPGDTIPQIMVAYDRAHTYHDIDGVAVIGETIDNRNPYIRQEGGIG